MTHSGTFTNNGTNLITGVTDEIQFARVLSMIRMYMSLRGVVEAWEHMNRNYPFDKCFVEFMQEQIDWANRERSHKAQNEAQG
jgi:hypothetical protein